MYSYRFTDLFEYSILKHTFFGIKTHDKRIYRE